MWHEISEKLGELNYGNEFSEAELGLVRAAKDEQDNKARNSLRRLEELSGELKKPKLEKKRGATSSIAFAIFTRLNLALLDDEEEVTPVVSQSLIPKLLNRNRLLPRQIALHQIKYSF